MGIVTAMEDLVLFGSDIPPATNRRLQLAVALRSHDPAEAERLLQEAREEDPCCLPVHYASYKFYANRRRLAEAEEAVRRALAQAACQGGFPECWRELARMPERWPLSAEDSGPFYLYSLKALAFVILRQNRFEEAWDVLDALERLDPEDRAGGSVVRALAESLGAEFGEAA